MDTHFPISESCINWSLIWIAKHTGLSLSGTGGSHSSLEALLSNLPRMPPLDSQAAVPIDCPETT